MIPIDHEGDGEKKFAYPTADVLIVMTEEE